MFFLQTTVIMFAAKVCRYPIVTLVANSSQILHRSGTSCVRSKVNLVRVQHYAGQTRVGAKRAAQSKSLKEMAQSPTSGSGTAIQFYLLIYLFICSLYISNPGETIHCPALFSLGGHVLLECRAGIFISKTGLGEGSQKKLHTTVRQKKTWRKQSKGRVWQVTGTEGE